MRKVVPATAAVAFIGFLIWFGLHNRTGSGNSFGRDAGSPDVTTIVANKGDVPVDVELPGRTSAYRVAQIRPQVGGIIEKRLFKEGADVTEGEALYQLNPAVYDATLNSAEANLKQAQATLNSARLKFNRNKKLIGTRDISQQDYDDSQAAFQQGEAGVAVAEAAVETAKLNVSYTKVYAPIEGRIGKSLVTEGALVTANQTAPIAVVTQLDPIYVDIEQPSTENIKLRSRLQRLDKVAVSIVQGGANTPFPHMGNLQFSDVSVDESTGSVALRSLFPNPEHTLLPGMFVTATLHLGSENAIAVPQQVVGRNLNGDAVVWVVEGDNSVHQQVVTIERSWKDKWIVSNGIKDGDVLVFEGFQRLSPGIKVVPHPRETGQ